MKENEDYSKTIVTWYFEQNADFGGNYPQVSGNSSKENFRDTYRRCLALFFTSAYAMNPDSKFILYLNAPWNPSSSTVAMRCSWIFQKLNIEIRIIEFSYAHLAKQDLWKNQFFVLDIIQHLALKSDSNELVILLDSDVIWLKSHSSSNIWDVIKRDGHALLEIEYAVDEIVNLSDRQKMTELYEYLEQKANCEPLKYYGGELVAFSGYKLKKLSVVIKETSMKIESLENQKLTFDGKALTEEAFFLSYCYKVLGIEFQNAQNNIKRIWTMFAKPRNSSRDDLQLHLWHLPAEKNYGIRRLYNKFLRNDLLLDDLSKLCADPVKLGIMLGVPSNSGLKIARDLSFAMKRRADKLLKKL